MKKDLIEIKINDFFPKIYVDESKNEMAKNYILGCIKGLEDSINLISCEESISKIKIFLKKYCKEVKVKIEIKKAILDIL